MKNENKTEYEPKAIPNSSRVAKSFRDMAYDGQAALEKKINDAFDQMKRSQKDPKTPTIETTRTKKN